MSGYNRLRIRKSCPSSLSFHSKHRVNISRGPSDKSEKLFSALSSALDQPYCTQFDNNTNHSGQLKDSSNVIDCRNKSSTPQWTQTIETMSNSQFRGIDNDNDCAVVQRKFKLEEDLILSKSTTLEELKSMYFSLLTKYKGVVTSVAEVSILQREIKELKRSMAIILSENRELKAAAESGQRERLECKMEIQAPTESEDGKVVATKSNSLSSQGVKILKQSSFWRKQQELESTLDSQNNHVVTTFPQEDQFGVPLDLKERVDMHQAKDDFLDVESSGHTSIYLEEYQRNHCHLPNPKPSKFEERNQMYPKNFVAKNPNVKRRLIDLEGEPRRAQTRIRGQSDNLIVDDIENDSSSESMLHIDVNAASGLNSIGESNSCS